MMKYYISLLLLVLFVKSMQAQSQDRFEITQHGIVSSEDANSSYIYVDIPNTKQNDILQGIREYIQKHWKDPMNSLKIENNSAIISYNHDVSVASKEYRLEGVMTIDVKDNKLRVSFNFIGLYREVRTLAIYQHYHFTKEHCPPSSFYFRRGIYEGDKVKYPNQKEAIEDFLNQEVRDISTHLLKRSQMDW